MKTIAGLSAGILVSLLCSSCIEFERQDLWFKYDKDSDTLRIFQLYSGIFGGKGDAASLKEEEIKELDSVMGSERTFFFANWLWEYHRSDLEGKVVKDEFPDAEKLRSGVEKSGLSEDEYRADWNEAHDIAKKFIQTLLDSVSVENGEFFLDYENKPCGWQFVEVRNIKKLIESANDLINAHIKLEGSGNGSTLSRAAESDHQWLSIDDDAFVVKVPMPMDKFVEFKRKAGADLLKNADKKDSCRHELKKVGAILESDAWVSYTDGMAAFNVGFPGRGINRLWLPVHDGYKPNAIGFIGEKYGLREKSPDIQAMMKAFLNKGEKNVSRGEK